MAAGITCAYNREGLETRGLVERAWPVRYGEREPDALGFTTTNAHYGVHVPSHAGQSYTPPIPKGAGDAKRAGAYYQATGCLSNRVEQGFKNTLGHCGLTEAPVHEYGTMRRTGSYMLHPQSSATVSGATSILPPRHPSTRSEAGSQRSRRSEGAFSMRSRSSSASSIPSWAKKYSQRQEPWNFETLPMYQRTNETYGQAPMFRDANAMRNAGRSDSGYIAPNDLVKVLTQRRE